MKILIVSDIHGNLPALKKVLRKERSNYDNIWSLGDMTGYGPYSNECVLLLKKAGALMLAGNHDLCLSGQEPADRFSLLSKAALEKIELSVEVKMILQNMPSFREQNSIALVHGAPSGPVWNYILSAHDARRELAQLHSRGVFFGHTHVPVIYLQQGARVESCPIEWNTPISLRNNRFLINPGSVGQPRDGNPAASYILFDDELKQVIFRRCSYPVSKVQKPMKKQHFPERLITRLAEGS